MLAYELSFFVNYWRVGEVEAFLACALACRADVLAGPGTTTTLDFASTIAAGAGATPILASTIYAAPLSAAARASSRSGF